MTRFSFDQCLDVREGRGWWYYGDVFVLEEDGEVVYAWLSDEARAGGEALFPPAGRGGLEGQEEGT